MSKQFGYLFIYPKVKLMFQKKSSDSPVVPLSPRLPLCRVDWIHTWRGQQGFTHMDGQTGGEWPPPPPPSSCHTSTQALAGLCFHHLPSGRSRSFSSTISQVLCTLTSPRFTQSNPHAPILRSRHFLKTWTQSCCLARGTFSSYTLP